MMHTSRLARTGLIAALVVVGAVALASCSSGEPEQSPQLAPNAEVPPSPLGEKMVRCMQEEGWEATVNWGGAVVGPEMPTSQVDLWMEAERACADKTKFGDLSQLSTTQIEELYTQEVAEYKCLLDHGKSPATPPSEQLYVETFRTGEQYYAIKGTIASPELMRLCPAPTWFLNLKGLE